MSLIINNVVVILKKQVYTRRLQLVLYLNLIDSRRCTIAKKQQDTTNVNNQIRAEEVRIIGSDGEQIGILSIKEALERAAGNGMDLVEVSPNAKPPVCKIMDYGKYKYQCTKQLQDAKKKQKGYQVKEIKVRPKTEAHDLETKVKNIERFILKKNKVKITLVFRGREIILKEQGQRILEKLVEMTDDFAQVEQSPKYEGRVVTMLLSPK
ncbi:MAG: translation initiation factor IF-3 [Desulfobacterales bacterium]|nr:translation initiation factor IF-3 [Desulfobacterales bacterium]